MNELNKKILSDITVYMKYAKYIPELNRRETWEELVTRNKEMHQKRYPELYNAIEENYRFVYKKKVLPSMRSLQFSGKPIEVSFSQPFASIRARPSSSPCRYSESLIGLGPRTGAKEASSIGKRSPMEGNGKRVNPLSNSGLICLLSSFKFCSPKIFLSTAQPLFEAPPASQRPPTR